MRPMPFVAMLLLATPFASEAARPGFLDSFDRTLIVDPRGQEGWAGLTGDGDARIALGRQDGHAVMAVDAREDRRGIWWAVMKRSVSPFIDQHALARPDRELRVEARVRSHHAPRRINMSFNHSRTSDFHANLAEYDLPDTGWHVVSLTTRGFDALPGDEIFVQLAMIDWGVDAFRLDVDYVKVEVVDPAEAGPDLGSPLPYRPELPPLDSFSTILVPAADAMVDRAWPEVNFRFWSDMSDGDPSPALSVSSSQMILLRWDFAAYRDRRPTGWGVLDLTTESVQWAPTALEEFGYVRIVEILYGDEGWNRDTVTLDSFRAGRPLAEVLNGQLIVDVPPSPKRGGKTLIPVSPPVLQRLMAGRSRGLAIHAQGAVNATFHSSADPDEGRRPKLYFNAE